MSQKAAVYMEKFQPVVIQERPIPKPGNNELLVKVTSVGVNPIDIKIIEYGLPMATPPAILGADVSGTVEEVGSGVTNYKKSDKVIVWTTRQNSDHGGFQQYVLASTVPYATAKLPDNISEDEAATIPVGLHTAHIALADSDGLGYPCPFENNESFGEGKSFLVGGASSIVGLATLQLVRLLGFSQIIATASTKHEALVKKYGATHVIDRTQPIDAQVEQIRYIAPSLDAAVNAVGVKETDAVIAKSLVSGGRFISVLDVDKGVLAENPNVSGKMIIGIPSMHPESGNKVGIHLTDALETGKLLPFPYKVYGGLESIAEALQAVKKASGYKVLIHAQE